MLTIGSLILPSKFILAPMAGVTDLPYRIINRRYGCRCAVTEMISAKALTYRNKKTFSMIAPVKEDRPLGLQLFGSERDVIESAVGLIPQDSYDFLDLNAACPVNKVVQSGEGSAMMKDIPNLTAILRTMVKGTQKPVTVKIRAGWGPNARNAVDVAKAAEDSGVSAVFIHGRTRDQFYAGSVDRSIIADVKRAVSVPVIASGDIFSPYDAVSALRETGCDGVLIARGSYGDPWIFRNADALLADGALLALPSGQEVSAVMREHFAYMRSYYGDEHGVVLFRKVFVWYTKGFSGIKDMRKAVFAITDVAAISSLIDDFERSGYRHEETSIR
jgi:nifR3 family TIM-barrel protein